MRTLQEKYNGIQEGKFSKEHFLAEARMQQPQLITRFNGYDDAVQILKNKGMIQEVKVDTETLKDVLRGGKKIASGVRFINAKDYKDGNKVGTLEKGDQVLDSKEIKEARLTNKSLTDYRYKPTNEMDKYPYEQILRGLRVELEGLSVHGTPTADEYKKALGKVLKNLEKDEIFYTNRVAGIKAGKDLHDKMIEADKKNTVDTFNGLKKAELKEGIKNIIKKILSENTKKASNLSLRPGDVLINKFSGSKYTVINVEGDSVYTENEAGEEVEINSLRNYELTESSEELSDFQDYYDEEEEDIYEMYGDSDGDYEYDKEVGAEAEMLYDKGKRFATAGEPVKGEALRQAAIKKGSWLGWGVEDFPPYEEADDISHPLGYEDQDEIDYDDENFSDPFIDGDLDEQKSEKELRAEWEKHQATSHPEDKMSYMEWRSEQGLEEAIDTEVGKRVTFTNTNDGNKYTGTLVQDLGNGRFTFRAKDGKVYGSEGFGSNWKIEFEASKKATPEIPSFKGTRDALDDLFESVSLKDIL